MSGQESGTCDRSGVNCQRFVPWCIIIGAALVLSLYLSPRPFWIDARGYESALAEGRSVIHPPGYMGFLYLAGRVNQVLDSAYRSLQLVSAACYLASIGFMFATLKRHTTPAVCAALTLAYAFNWVCLNIATVGTSHASDLLFGAILVYLASLPRPSSSSRWWHPALFTALVCAVSFRTSSVIVAGPFLVLILLRDYRLWRFWISAAIAGILMVLLVWTTAGHFGGWEVYREASAALHQVNARSGLLTGGGWKNGGMNLLRGGWWLFLAFPLLLFLVLMRKHRRIAEMDVDWSLLLVGALVGCVLLVDFGYLCVHPGYLALAIPPMFVLLARVIRPSGVMLATCFAQALLALLLFFVPKPILPPTSAGDAVANSFFLQFTARAHRESVANLSLGSWLFLAGRTDLIPPHRRGSAEHDLRTAQDYCPAIRR
jgi:hypothetical protein